MVITNVFPYISFIINICIDGNPLYYSGWLNHYKYYKFYNVVEYLFFKDVSEIKFLLKRFTIKKILICSNKLRIQSLSKP